METPKTHILPLLLPKKKKKTPPPQTHRHGFESSAQMFVYVMCVYGLCWARAHHQGHKVSSVRGTWVL